MMENGYEPKRRGTGERNRKSICYVIAEGNNKTELKYFKGIRDSSYNIKFISNMFTDPVNMAESVVKYCDSSKYEPELGDIAFCFVDGDVLAKKNDEISKADEELSKLENANLILSNPCFEIWFLNHFGYSTRQFVDSDSVVSALKKEMPLYSKSIDGMYDQTKENIKTAIKNSKKQEKYCEEIGYKRHTVDFQPSTEVYKVIETLLPECNNKNKNRDRVV